MKRPALVLVLAALAAPAPADAQRRDGPADGARAPGNSAGSTARRGRRGGGATGATPATTNHAPASTETSLEAAEVDPPSTPMPDTDTAIQLIQTAAVAGNAAGAHSIALLLLRGLAPRAAAAGLDALGVLGRPEGAPVVARFLVHRRVSLRRHAIAAAQAIHTPSLVRALAAKLSDTDENVRVEAATALAEVGNRDSVERLMAAFERDLDSSTGPEGGRLTHEAARAVARVGSAEDVTRLLGFLRRAPFRTMADSMRIAMGRADLPEALKLRIVSAIGDLATGEVREFLNGVIADAHGHDNAVVRAARTAAERIAQ